MLNSCFCFVICWLCCLQVVCWIYGSAVPLRLFWNPSSYFSGRSRWLAYCCCLLLLLFKWCYMFGATLYPGRTCSGWCSGWNGRRSHRSWQEGAHVERVAALQLTWLLARSLESLCHRGCRSRACRKSVLSWCWTQLLESLLDYRWTLRSAGQNTVGITSRPRFKCVARLKWLDEGNRTCRRRWCRWRLLDYHEVCNWLGVFLSSSWAALSPRSSSLPTWIHLLGIIRHSMDLRLGSVLMCASRAIIFLRFLATECRLVATQLRRLVCCLLYIPFVSSISRACLTLASTGMVHEDLTDRCYLTGELRQVDCTILVMTVLLLCFFLRWASHQRVLYRLLSFVIFDYRCSCVEVELRLLLDHVCRQGIDKLLNTLLAWLTINRQIHALLNTCIGLVDFLSRAHCCGKSAGS